MSDSITSSPAQARIERDGADLLVTLHGTWRITGLNPRWEAPGGPLPATLRFDLSGLETWDSSLALYLGLARAWCLEGKVVWAQDNFPDNLRKLVAEFDAVQVTLPPKDRSPGLLTYVGIEAQNIWKQVFDISRFVGECVLSFQQLVRKPALFRWRDCLSEMQQCGAMALPIVSLVSFLVGVTLAYTGAIVLRLVGGDIWVADLVGLSVTREMGALMTAVVLAGRTGAAYAAQLGNMKANEEIDALETLGVSPINFLVAPRLLALALMTPLLALYANCLGIFGGMVIALGILEIPPTAYWVEMLTIVDLSDICTGLLKASVFGIIIGMSGCLRGLQADRSAAGVGNAATSAVVTSILLMVIADSLFAVIFNILGW